MNPQVLPDEMAEFYPSDYRPHQTKMLAPRKRSSAEKVGRKRRPLIALISAKLTRQTRLLDLGCGNGSFINRIHLMAGCEVYGVDISQVAARAAKEHYDLDVFAGTIFESPFPDSYFDVITAWSYLEHVNEPSKVLSKLSSLLKPDGLCLLNTPNFNSFNSRLFKDKWYHLDCPRHLYIYTLKTLAALLEKSGLSIVKIAYERNSRGLLGSLQYYFYGDNCCLGHRNRIRRSKLVKTMLSPLPRILAFLRQSDTIAVLARRTP
ncbi:MAG: class I SAM-dependent methyltransferase [Planctomycetota bacterium]|jgi:2-polyprenyl-3-methyl-5-hydroxy-6-metoxy-1,4-benzoquinol methylase